MDILASQLHSKIKEAPIEECRDLLKKMTMPQAVKLLKEKYSKESIRKQLIDDLKASFPEKSLDSVSKALDSANNDYELAFQILLENPESIEDNKKKSVIPKTSSIKKRKPVSSIFLTNKPHESKLPDINQQSNYIANQKSQSSVKPSINQSATMSRSLDLKDDEVIRVKSKNGSEHYLLPRKEIPQNTVQSSWNKSSASSFLFRNFHLPFFSNNATQSNSNQLNDNQKNPIFVDDSDADDITVLSTNNDNYFDDDEEEEEYEYEYEYDDDDEESQSQGMMTKRIDLHGYVKDDARLLVEDQISHARENRIGVFHFITGRGNHSEGNKAILRPLVLEICKKYNVHGYIPEKNPGMVLCNISKPYGG
ncbi:hypothetical protein M9Y10_025936 [Tritrichomonas musculus]|uniref:Smr domain-containing protein n=1 Tax=Tritrichomonas musculus TaxID=1915356 RepID=A0ABR2H9V8_9EUKA